MNSASDSPLQSRIVLTFSLTVFVFSLSAWMVMVYLPIYLEKVVHLSRSYIGLLISIYTVTLLVLVAPFGHFSDKVSPRRIVQLGMVLFAGHCLLLAAARTLSLLVAAQILGGMGNSLVIIALQSLYYKHLTAYQRGRKVGLYIFAVFFGFAIGPLVSGAVLGSTRLSYRAVFLMAGLLVIGLLFFSRFLKDSVPFKIRLLDYKQDLLRKEVFLLIAMLIAMGVHFGNERTSFALYMSNVVGLNDFSLATVFALVGVWIATMTLLTGAIFDRNKKVLLFVCGGLVLSGAAHIGTAYTWSYGTVLLARIVHTTGDAVVIFSMNAIIASIFPATRMGGNFGFTTFFRMQGAFLGALVSGLLDAHSSYRASFIFAGSFTIVVGFLFAANWRTVLNLSRELSK